MDKLRYLDLGAIPARLQAALMELVYHWAKPCPTLLTYHRAQPTLIPLGGKHLSEMYHVAAIDDNVELYRIYLPDGHSSPGFLGMPSDVVVLLLMPEDTLDWILDVTRAATARAIQQLVGIRCYRGKKKNDLYIEHNKRRKKIYGDMVSIHDGWLQVGHSITVDFDLEQAQRIFRLDQEKFTKKGNVKSIGELVVGLRDLKPELDPDELKDVYVCYVAERLGMNLVLGSLTVQEQDAIERVAKALDTKEWIVRGIWPFDERAQ